MAITETTRRDMHVKVEQALGPEEAATLMEHLPPVGWADVATKHDLDVGLRSLANELRAEWRGELNRQLLAIMAMNIAMVGAIIAAVNAIV